MGERFYGGGQATSYFNGRKKQLNRSESAVEPMGIPMVKEMIQNADDRKAEHIFLVFTDKSLWITNDGETFNYNETVGADGERERGDLANLLGVSEGLAEAEEDRVGRHGTGFELIYCVGNRFEIHWWDRTHGDRVSMRSNPELLESGASETWDYPWDHSDFDALDCPFDIEERQEDRRGVLFKADWRTKKGAEQEYGEHGPIFKNAAFPQWDKAGRRSFFDSCKAYAPFMIQFCKSITDMTVIWLQKGKSEFFKTTRRDGAYPTSEYTGNSAGEFGCEEVEIGIKSGKCDNKSALRGFFGVKEEIQKLWSGKKYTRDYRIRLLHGWAAVHGTSGVGNNMDMDLEKTLASWKLPQYGQFHTHNEYDCPRCPKRNQDGWIPDRTSVVHIHMPLDPIDEELGRLEKPGQTLLHSILPLGVVSPNRFMVSADLYVNEGRAQLEFQGDKGVWNSCSALTAFWLHSKMLSQLSSGFGWGKIEAAILQALPADAENWFGSLNLSSDGFPDGADLIGEGRRSKLYFDLSKEPWVLDTKGVLCSPSDILIPTNEEDEYDDDIRVVLERVGMPVMRRGTHDHILSTGSYVLDNLRNLLRKCRVYDPSLGGGPRSQMILEGVGDAELDDLSIECKIALARLVVHLAPGFGGAVYPDENGKLRTQAEFRTIPEGLSVLQELQGERPALHPDIENLFEPGVTTVQDALDIIQRMQEREAERFEHLDEDPGLLDVTTRMADQILSDAGITDKDKIRYDFIPCRFGGHVFLRAYQHLVECGFCEWNNPPLIEGRRKCVECGKELDGKDVMRRIVLPTTRREDWSRMHIMSPEEQDIQLEVSQRIVTACSAMHFSDKLADTESKVGLMRYLGKKGGKGANAAKQDSLFHEEVLMEWLGLDGSEHDDDDVAMCRQTFLEELKDYARTGGRTNLRGLFSDSPIFYDRDYNWAPASEFILYIDEVTLQMLQRGDAIVRTPHPELLEEEQSENEWMTLSELGGAKKNVEFEHLEAAIRGLLGEVLDSYGVETDDKCRSLASIAAHLLRHEDLLEDKSEGFDNLAWVPIGHQDGFDNESDLLCRWSEFPLPGPEFDSIWGGNRYNPHITHDEKPVSPHGYFDDSDLEWMRAKQTEDESWASSVGMSTKPSAERMFLALISEESPHRLQASVPEGLYQLLSELEGVPERYQNSVHRFFHPRDGAWHEGIGEGTLLVESPLEGELIGGSCVSREGLSAAAQTVLEVLLRCGTTRAGIGSSEAISRISRRWGELPRRRLRDAVPLLKRLWRSFHDVEGAGAAVDCWTSNGESVLFPLGDDVRGVDSIVICPGASALHHFKGRGGVFTIDELAQKDDEELELRRSHLAHALSSNGALVWDVITEGGVSSESRARITRLRDELGLEGEGVDQEDAYAWASAMLELEGWYPERGGRTAVPFPHWRRAELVIDLADADNVYFAPAGSVHADMVADFRMMGLEMLHIRQEDEESITDIPGRTAEDGPFPGFDEGITVDNVDIGPGDRDGFAPLSNYLGDLLTAIEHRFEGPIEGASPLLFLSQLINGYRTPKKLRLRWTVGGVEVTKGERYWTVEITFSDPPVWPQVDVTYRTVTPERHRETIIRSVLETGLRKRLDRDSEDAEGERARLANALGRPEPVFSADILAIVGPLLRYANPRSWEEVSGFEGVWEGRNPRLSSDLILNPDVQAAREKILTWYNDMGCQICGQLTPDGPGSRSHEESRVQIFKRRGTKYRWESATEQGGDVGNWLYLCPTHHRLHTVHCLELHVLVGDEEVELADLVDKARRDRGVLSAISEDRIYYNIFERRGESDASPWEEDAATPSDWTGIAQVQRIEGDHVRKIVAKIRDYVNHRLG